MITISLCVIVKNEADVLARMLDSAAPIADEIIIVDTGSSDSTKEIARAYTSLIYDFPWTQDFSAARNYACSKAQMEYWMWLDADDVISSRAQKELLSLKDSLDPNTDIVMMKYVSGFDQTGKPALSYYRERLIKNKKGFTWKGRVHEAVTPSGAIAWVPIEIEHRKVSSGDPDRNLKIYESMIRQGEVLEPRHQYYYGRELLDHGKFSEAVTVLEHFLTEPNAWTENKIDACLLMAHAYEQTQHNDRALTALFKSFLYDTPRAEICCKIGLLKQKDGLYKQAIYWYKQALLDQPDLHPGAFMPEDFYQFIPYIQLCICYDCLKNYKTAFIYHTKAQKLKPESDAVRHNQAYFESIAQTAPDLFDKHIV